MENYQYPLDLNWSTEEMILVVNFWADLEKVYEQGMDRQAFLNSYQSFKSVVKSIGEERKLGREFEELSGYSLYHAVKQAKASQNKRIKM
ncbi:UPF0223 family protein [Enterococcus cecorum]|uniref:UPF0223 protein A5869_000699 n=1 Tax=Enterococcus cecorum TaxID=44008 RepID=A0A0J0ANM4_9ENTE|nr:UPF0223 family protein [Enterococcus cecorum]KLO67692.1 hypothetical protein AA985_02000 [Enterococcus cecorum]KLO72356.1 hypothetical protein AA987_02175 [Enterococcus cecorum]MBM6935126.1 UPF0223 family protein [Enterococcus cecorum]MCJ0552956.1 UPF0223 family protein [Enterococcus cecorum]MCJ0556851.1 UPF0223 family protein [Enterococcus cecorum]